MDKRNKEVINISVCMATYNGELFLKNQIDSILSQLGEDSELIISDDGSSDGTINIIKQYNDARIRLFINRGKHGYTPNFYNALKYARGKYIFLSDQDDIWCENKVKICVSYLEKYDFIHSDAEIVDSNGGKLYPSRNRLYGVKNGFVSNLTRSRYIGCCMAFDKKVLKSIFPVPTYSNSYPHDLWIALIAERYYKTVLLQEPLIKYRRHEKNASDGGKGERKGVLTVFPKVAYRFYYYYFVVRQRKVVNNVKRENS